LEREFYLTVVEHINNYNLILPEMNKLSSNLIFDPIDPSIYQFSNKDEERLIQKGLFNQYFGSILSTISYRIDLWILNIRNMLHIKSQKFVPDKVYKKLPSPIKKTVDEAAGCYEHNYLTACAIMLRKALEDSIYLKFRMENKEDTLYDQNGRRLSLETMINTARDLHYISSQLTDRLIRIKLFGDVGAHSYKIELWDRDIDRCIDLIRLALEELFYDRR
jgi:hypothetical protein